MFKYKLLYLLFLEDLYFTYKLFKDWNSSVFFNYGIISIAISLAFLHYDLIRSYIVNRTKKCSACKEELLLEYFGKEETICYSCSINN